MQSQGIRSVSHSFPRNGPRYVAAAGISLPTDRIEEEKNMQGPNVPCAGIRWDRIWRQTGTKPVNAEDHQNYEGGMEAV